MRTAADESVPEDYKFSSTKTSTLLIRKLCCMCLKTTKQWSKSHNETCFQDPQRCSWLVIRPNQFGHQNPNQIHWHQQPTRRHTDKGKFLTWWMESSFVFVNISHFSSTNCFWSDVGKNARRCRWRKSHSKIEADDEFSLAMQRKESWRACLDCIRKPRENQIWKSITSELVELAATKNGETYDGRLFIKLLRMEYCDEKWSSQEWKSEEVLEARTERLVSGQPAGSFNSTQTDLSSIPMIWTLTPPQNQTFR